MFSRRRAPPKTVPTVLIRTFWCTTIAILIGSQPGLAQTYEVADSVQLVERDIDIPAHPGPNDHQVPFRFASGSTAVILSKDPGSGWLQIQGEKVTGYEAVGWITPTYIAGPINPTAPDPVPAPELAWCPEKGSSDPHPSGRLRLATWNLGNLHAEDGQSTYGGSQPSVKRYSVDYMRIRCYVRSIDPDILAVQEVDGEEPLLRVVDPDVYDVHVSQRPQPGGLNGGQNTGFSYKKGLEVTERPDLTELDVSAGSLRYGARIDLSHNGHQYQLLSVHLKSGCFDNQNSGSSCNKLFQQPPLLEDWVDSAASAPDPPIFLGEFNRRLNHPNGIFWTNLDDAAPANSDLTSVTDEKPISCRDNQYTSFIDHIVFDRRGIEHVDLSSFRHMTFRQADKESWDRISDHCPVIVEMWVSSSG